MISPHGDPRVSLHLLLGFGPPVCGTRILPYLCLGHSRITCAARLMWGVLLSQIPTLLNPVINKTGNSLCQLCAAVDMGGVSAALDAGM